MASDDPVAAACVAGRSPLSTVATSGTAVLLVGSMSLHTPLDPTDAARAALLGVAATGVLAVSLWAAGGSLVGAWLACLTQPPDTGKSGEGPSPTGDAGPASPQAPAPPDAGAVRAHVRTLEFCINLCVTFVGAILAAAAAGVVARDPYGAIVIIVVALAAVLGGTLGAISATTGLREIGLRKPPHAAPFLRRGAPVFLAAAAVPVLVLTWLAASLPPAHSPAGAFFRTTVYAAAPIRSCDPIPMDALYTRPGRTRDPAVLAPFVGARPRSHVAARQPITADMLLTPSAALQKCPDLRQLIAVLDGGRAPGDAMPESREPYGRLLVFLLLEAVRAGLGEDEIASIWTKALGQAGDIVKDMVKAFANRAAELSAERLFGAETDRPQPTVIDIDLPFPFDGGGAGQRRVACRAQDPGERLLFAPNRAVVSRQGQVVVDRLVERALAIGNPRFLITGHADRTGSDRFNLRLSMDRVEAVMAALARRGVAYDLMLLQAFGASWPVKQRSAHLNDADRRVTVRLCSVSGSRQSSNIDRLQSGRLHDR